MKKNGLREQLIGAWRLVSFALIHIQFLAQVGLRISVFLQWVSTYIDRAAGFADHRETSDIGISQRDTFV